MAVYKLIRVGDQVHLADGVLSIPVVALTSVGAATMVAYAIKGVQEEEIPKISLMTGAFFAISLIHIPIGPSSVHLMMGGLLGIVLGRRAPLAIFVGLLLQALLFHHGGITTLGANTLVLALPAMLAYKIFHSIRPGSPFLRGAIPGGAAPLGSLGVLIIMLLLTDQRFGDGNFSVINFLIVGHLPLAVIEAVITGAAVKLLMSTRPQIISKPIH